MGRQPSVIPIEGIACRIYLIRGETVMAHGDEILLSTFSNPARLHPVLRVPVGAADHNNGDTIRQTARIVQAFRKARSGRVNRRARAAMAARVRAGNSFFGEH